VRRISAAAAAALAAVTLSSCGATARSTDTSPSAIHDGADVMFAQWMIPHHQQAVDMAAMVPSRSANPTLRVVAIHISTDQRAEIGMLTDLLNRWGVPTAAPSPAPGAMSMEGMVDDATMKRLPTLSGAEFDTLWITAMIGHHRGAVSMAQDELAHGQSPDAQKMAQLIITAQKREISYMSNLISTAA
jgi:uncharacterized protein (DUF305 family)